MIYEFESSDGKRIEENFPMGKCPESLEKDGVIYSRIFSCGGVMLGGVKYIGDLAEKNTKDRERAGLNKPKPDNTPWWRKGKDWRKTRKLLEGTSQKQKDNYIRTGKIDG